MPAIEILVPAAGTRLWQKILIDRLRAADHDIGVTRVEGKSGWPLSMRAASAFERRLFRRPGPGLADLAAIAESSVAAPAALRFDLAGSVPDESVPTLRLAFDGSFSDTAVLAATAAGRLPDIEAILDGKIVARAAPMIDKRESAVLGSDDVLARAITLGASVVGRMADEMNASSSSSGLSRGSISSDAIAAAPAEQKADFHGDSRQPRQILGTSPRMTGLALAAPAGPQAIATPMREGGNGGDKTHRHPPFLRPYVFSALPRLGREALRRARFRHAHWRAGYRFTEGPGVAETGELGTGWRQVPDDGSHFYADPFPFEWQGRSFIFVEDYPHATGKALISVVEVDETGTTAVPRPVLEEPFHLSYPQTFECDGAIWMLPEASASNRVTLYRAERFPDRWAAETVLIDGMAISDATLLEHDGRFWLFATWLDGHGSTSDTLVVFHAPSLTGPWTPHRRNPILIDRRKARPGGAFQRIGDRILLPVQDGTQGYGGGLGLSELLQLDESDVRLSDPVSIMPAGDWPYPQIHTLNRIGRLEVIDGIAAVRRAR